MEFWNLKSALIEVVWGSLLCSYFPIMFREVHTAGERKGEIRVTDKQFSRDAHVVEFRNYTPSVFNLADVFEVTMSNGEKIVVALEERAVIESLYTDEIFYTAVRKNLSCVLRDVCKDGNCGSGRVVVSCSGATRNVWWTKPGCVGMAIRN